MGGNDYLPRTRGLTRRGLWDAFMQDAEFVGQLFLEDENNMVVLNREAVLRWCGAWYFNKFKTYLGVVNGTPRAPSVRHRSARNTYTSFYTPDVDTKKQTQLWLEAFQEAGDEIPTLLERPPCYEDFCIQIQRLQHIMRPFLSADSLEPLTGGNATDSGWNHDGSLRTHENKTANKLMADFHENETKNVVAVGQDVTAQLSMEK